MSYDGKRAYKAMITPNERHTPLAKAIGHADVFLKREDLHPYGSHKGRSIPPMIDRYLGAGDSAFAVSSSGNAALAAAMHIRKINDEGVGPASLDVFVGNHVAPHKLAKLEEFADENIRILKKERPLQALTLSAEEGVRSLRQSTDDEALKGYASLAEELSAIENLGAVFMGTSSGTTVQALAQYFLSKKTRVQVHIVQTSSCHPLSDGFAAYEGPDEQSVADAITDITAYRKSALIPLIEKTGGTGWFAANEDIETARVLTKKHADLDISANSALSVAGAMKAAYGEHEITGAVACILGGR